MLDACFFNKMNCEERNGMVIRGKNTFIFFFFFCFFVGKIFLWEKGKTIFLNR